MGEGHFDLQSYLLLSKELKVVSLPIGIENSICWVIPPLPDDGDAIIAVVLNDSTLWMISLACSLVIKEITNLPMIPSSKTKSFIQLLLTSNHDRIIIIGKGNSKCSFTQ